MITGSPTQGHEQEIKPGGWAWVEADSGFASSPLAIRKLKGEYNLPPLYLHHRTSLNLAPPQQGAVTWRGYSVPTWGAGVMGRGCRCLCE